MHEASTLGVDNEHYGPGLWNGRKLPKSADIEDECTNDYKLHVRATAKTINDAKMHALALTCSERNRDFYINSTKWTDPKTFEALRNASRAERFKGVYPARLSVEDIALLLKCGLIVEIDPKEAVAGCKIWKHPEHEKKRFRILCWTEVVNNWYPKTLLQPLNLPLAEDIMDMTLDGLWTQQFDLDCSFYQQSLVRECQLLCSFLGVDDKTYCFTRTVMGARSSVEILQGIIQCLADVESDPNLTDEERTLLRGLKVKCYVDNIFFAHESREAVELAGKIFIRRCNEVDVTLGSIGAVTQKDTFLGVWCDFENGLVAAGEKVMRKLKRSWARRGSWTARNLAAHIGILNFASRILGWDKAKSFDVLRFCATALTLDRNDPRWDEAIEVPPEIQLAIEKWTEFCLENRPRKPRRRGEPYSHVLVTDASSLGYGWSLVCLTTGKVLVGRGEWEFNGQYRTSTNGETLAPTLALLQANFPLTSHDHVFIMSDNRACVAAHRRGYSRRQLLNDTMLRMHETFPNLRCTSVHTKGETIPVDGLSRYKVTPEQAINDPKFWKELQDCLQAVAVDVFSLADDASDDREQPMQEWINKLDAQCASTTVDATPKHLQREVTPVIPFRDAPVMCRA